MYLGLIKDKITYTRASLLSLFFFKWTLKDALIANSCDVINSLSETSILDLHPRPRTWIPATISRGVYPNWVLNIALTKAVLQAIALCQVSYS